MTERDSERAYAEGELGIGEFRPASQLCACGEWRVHPTRVLHCFYVLFLHLHRARDEDLTRNKLAKSHSLAAWLPPAWMSLKRQRPASPSSLDLALSEVELLLSSSQPLEQKKGKGMLETMKTFLLDNGEVQIFTLSFTIKTCLSDGCWPEEYFDDCNRDEREDQKENLDDSLTSIDEQFVGDTSFMSEEAAKAAAVEWIVKTALALREERTKDEDEEEELRFDLEEEFDEGNAAAAEAGLEVRTEEEKGTWMEEQVKYALKEKIMTGLVYSSGPILSFCVDYAYYPEGGPSEKNASTTISVELEEKDVE